MKNILAVMAVAILLLCGCTYGIMSGSGNPQTRQYDLQNFSGIEVGGAFQVTVNRSNSYSISITLDDNLFDYLVVDRSGSTLTIRLRPGYTYGNYTARAAITLPDLRSIDLSGASNGTVSGFNSTGGLSARVSGAGSIDFTGMVIGGNITFVVSGASRLTGSVVVGGNANFDASGASSITLSGSANNLEGDASGASRLGLDNFQVHNATINLSGASFGTVNMDGTLNAGVSGASYLQYIGSPVMGRINTSGGSSISKK